MKTLSTLLATVLFSITSVAFAGTEISHRPIVDFVDFFKGDASNFRITSVSLGKDAVTVTDKSDDQCLATAETPEDCHSYSYEYANVVHLDVTFDSSESQYEDGGNVVTLSLPQSEFNTQELAVLKKGNLKAASALAKLNVVPFVAQISPPSDVSQCLGDESLAECGDKVTYTETNVSKVRVSVSR